MVPVHQADGFGFCPAFEHLGSAAQFQILDQHDAIAVPERVAVGIFDDAGRFRCVRAGFGSPFMAASDTFVVLRVVQNIGHFAHRARRFAHDRRW